MQTVESRQPGVPQRAALAQLQTCPREAPLVLPAIWISGRVEPDELGALVMSTRSYHDRRLFDAVVATSLNSSASTELRLAAFGVMASYFDPMILEIVFTAGVQKEVAYSFARTIDGRRPRVGPEPFRSDYEQVILQTWKQIQEESEDPVVAGAAEYLLGRMPIRPVRG
jgi:hypothetical protein